MSVQSAASPIEELRLGTLIVAGPDATPLPLEHTDVVARISGPLAGVSVTQRFGNPFPEPVELAYLFPLPHEAAIVDFELRVGARTIRADLKEIEQARQAYAEAREQGRRAGLLEQRRPNLFSLEIANVQPGETIVAVVRYQERLRYDDSDYQFVFPMGITPKFHADPAEARQVDAPVAAAGAPIGTVDLSVSVDAGGPADDPRSPSHAIEVARLDERRFNVRVPGDVLPNKDFVLRYGVAAASVRAAAWCAASASPKGPAEGGAVVLVTALPPRLDSAAEPAPREFVFVLDRSGSMSGGPLDQARNALRACLRALGPQDSFAILVFDDQLEWFQREAGTVTQARVEEADRWLGRIDARGGTDILGAIDAALQLAHDHERRRYVVFLTDGAVSAEDEALRRVERQLHDARLFTFGIGPSVNRALLARVATLGRGTAEFLQLHEDIEEAIIRFQDRVAYPVLQDLTLRWEGTSAWDVYPARLPDLYIGQPLELVARVSGPGRLVISGRRERETLTLSVDLPPIAPDDSAVTRAWARARVDALLDEARADARQSESLRAKIIELALQYRLATPYTAFVAVDSETTGRTGESPRRVEVAVPLPEGLDYEGFFGAPQTTVTFGAMPPAPAALSVSTGTPKGMLAGGAGMLGGLADGLVTHAKKALPPRAEARVSREAEQPADDKSAQVADPSPAAPFGDVDRMQTLRVLARTQNVSGSWGSGAAELERTAEAVLAFVRVGHTTRSGSYRRQLAKAVKWLLAHAGEARGAARQACARALAAMAEATGDKELAKAVKQL
jgi:Ca-activated chloride channel family protein